MFCYRKDYTKAKEQLVKGKEFLHHSMKMMGISPWNHVGVVCFPNMEKRETLKNAGVVSDKDELQVFIKSQQDPLPL